MERAGRSGRRVLAVLALVLVGGVGWLVARQGEGGGEDAARASTAYPSGAEVVVYKSPTCGCCTGWVEHMRENGFRVSSEDVDNVAEKKLELGVPPGLGSCHTAVVDGYVIEGHVPADAIRRLLAERPATLGLAVPGMPMGSPGMEGSRKDSYAVLAFDEQGKTSVFARY